MPSANSNFMENPELRVELMNKYHTGSKEDRDYVTMYFIHQLDKYILKQIRSHFPVFQDNPTMMEDFVQAGYEAIIEYLPGYNPRFKPTTYFGNHIQNKMQDIANNENGVTHHGGQLNAKITKGLRYLDADADNVDPTILAELLNWSRKVTLHALSVYKNKKRIPIIDNNQNFEDTYHTNPEKLVMQREFYRIYEKAISHLAPAERHIICMHCGFYDAEYNPTEDCFKMPQIQSALRAHGDFSTNAANTYRIAKKNLRNELAKLGIEGRKSAYEQAKDEVELKIADPEDVDEVFDALNNLPLV